MAFDLPREVLAELYKSKSTSGIAKIYGVNPETIRKLIHKHGIAVKGAGGRRVFDPPAEELRALYQTMSMAQIAEHYQVGETVVFKRLKEHGIELDGFKNHRLKTGKTFSVEHRQALSKVKRGKWSGEKNPNWKNNARVENLRARASGEYKQWRYAALALAGFACQSCGAKHGAICECCGHKVTMHVHHVKSFADHPELRYDPSNAEVLCPKCHRASHDRKSGELLETP